MIRLSHLVACHFFNYHFAPRYFILKIISLSWRDGHTEIDNRIDNRIVFDNYIISIRSFHDRRLK